MLKESGPRAGGADQLPLMEEFFSVQGEGYHTGKPAWFIRIGGCDVGCHWCDVKESWDAKLHPLTSVNDMVASVLRSPAKTVVVTGGEPCMYDLRLLTSKLREKGIQVNLETSGAFPVSGTWDWVCLSPKKNLPVLPENFGLADELKMIVHNRDDFKFAESCRMAVEKAVRQKNLDSGSLNFFLQPEWSKRQEMLPLIVEFVQQNPAWRISLQTHKYIGIP